MFPIACFPIAHWYVFRGDWLWCGYGMIPAHTPSIVNGSISRCVWSLVISLSYSAMYELFSSFTSRYSTSPRLRKSLNPHRPALSSSRCSRVASGFAVRDDQKRPAHSPAVARDVQTTALRRVHADELADFPDSTQVPHVAREAIRRAVNAQDGPVEEHDGAARRVQLRAANQRQRLRAQRERELPQGLLLVVRGDVRHEREVFHEPARLPLRGVARAEHAPLRRLQRARAGDFPRLFKLARNPRHHPQRAYERKRLRTCVTPFRSMRNRFTVQFPLLIACSKPFDSVSCRMHFMMSNCVARLLFDNTASACRFKSALRRLKQSSNSSASSCPASSRRLFP